MADGAAGAAAEPQQGECVEVFGLESEEGREMNGQRGIVTGAFMGKGRMQVRLSPDKVVSLKAENLKHVTLGVQERLAILGLAPAQAAEKAPEPAKPEFSEGQRVQVFGLESEGGRGLNLQCGTVGKPVPGKDRLEVRFAGDRVVNIKPEHLRPAPEKGLEPDDLPFHAGHVVEAVGLASDLGKQLEGQTGIVRRYFQDRKRFEVSFSDKLVSLKPENLKKVEFDVAAEKKAAPEATPAPEAKEPEAAAPPAEKPLRSPRSSCRSSSSSSSRSRSRSRSTVVDQKYEVGWHVEVKGLTSETGRQLNGQKGTILKRLQGEGLHCRYEVCLGPEKFVSLKPQNMARSETGPSMEVDAKASAPPPKPKAEEKKGSLASLLGMGRAPEKEEKPKPAKWTSVFARSASDDHLAAATGKLTEDQVDLLKSVERNQERVEEEQMALRRKIAAELASQGAYDEDMVEELFKTQWEEIQLQKLLRPQDSTSDWKPSTPGARSRSRSRSGSSSSSSSSDDEKPAGGAAAEA